MLIFCVEISGSHRELPVQTLSFPTRRSYDIQHAKSVERSAEMRVIRQANGNHIALANAELLQASSRGSYMSNHLRVGEGQFREPVHERNRVPVLLHVRSDVHTSELQSLQRI